MAEKITYEEFEKLAARTESPHFNAHTLNVTTTHGIIGVQTEVGELMEAILKPDIINVREEIGDILHYLSMIVRAEKLQLTATCVSYHSLPSIAINMNIIACKMTDIMKKNIFYGQEPSIGLLPLYVCKIYSYIKIICDKLYFDIEMIMAENISKLKKRYPEKFTTEHSKLRLDKE